MKKTALLILGVFAAMSIYAQEITYKLKSTNTYLSEAQVDSISKIYGDNLKFEFKIENGKRIAIVDTNVSKNPVKQEFSINNNSKQMSIDTKNLTFKDANGTIISKDEFREHVKSGKYSHKYEMEEKNGKYLVTYILEEKVEAQAKRNNYEANYISNLVNTEFPLSDLTDINGNLITKESAKDKVLVFNFWFVGCKPCVEEMPQLNTVVSHFKDNSNVLFVAPALDEKSKLSQFIKDYNFLYTIIPDAIDFKEKLQIGIYPTHIVVGKDGLIKEVILGVKKDIDVKLIELVNQNLKPE